MLIGSTFAWFTDSASTGVNTIQAGNLDIEVTHESANQTTPEKIDGLTKLFVDKDGNRMEWEPGAVSYETFTVSNVGSLAFKYNMKLHIDDYNAVIDSQGNNTGETLKDVLKVKVLTGDNMLETITRDNVATLGWSTSDSALDVFTKDGGNLYPVSSSNTNEEEFQVVVYWMPTENDNDWNVNNGKTTSDGNPLFINFGIDLVATQLQYENDSFGNDYDKDLILADLPKTIQKVFETASLKLDAGNNAYNGTESVQVLNKSTNEAVATMPAEAANAVGNTLAARASDRDNESDLNTVIMFDISTESATENSVVYNIEATAKATYTNTNGVETTINLSPEDTDAALINGGSMTEVPLNIGKGLTSVSVKHNGVVMNVLSSETENEEGYFYNPTTGILTIKSITFSPFEITFDSTVEPVASIGSENYAKLEYAIAAVNDEETIVLRKSLSESAYFDESFGSKNVTLDLNGNSVAGLTAFAGNITVNNGTITGRTNAYDSSTLTLGSGLAVNSYVVVWGDGTYGVEGCKTPTLNVYATINNATEYAAVTTNGTDMSKPVINVYDSAKITNNDIAIYLPSGSLNIFGGEITGATGVYFKSTDLNISGGTIVGNGEKVEYDFNGNGANATGDALVIDNCNYPAGIGSVTITGGTFISENAKSVGSYAGNGQENPLSGFIFGGIFSSNPKDYVSDGFIVVPENNQYVVYETWANGAIVYETADDLTINTVQDFANFAATVNGGKTYSGKTVSLGADLDIGEKYWMPINGFTGTFDGGNYTISNLKVYGGTNGSGFGLFGNSNAKTIKNINVNNVYVYGNSAVAAVLGKGNTTIENAHVTGTILLGTTTDQGYLPSFNSSYIGGIVGYGYTKVYDSSVIGDNQSMIGGGDKHGRGRQVGGIYGFLCENMKDAISNCSVKNITLIGSRCVGGITGWLHYQGNITNCSVENVVVEVTGTEKNTAGLITGTTVTNTGKNYDIFENNTATNCTLIVNDEILVDVEPPFNLYASYSSGACYIKRGDNTYIFCETVDQANSIMQAGDVLVEVN